MTHCVHHASHMSKIVLSRFSEIWLTNMYKLASLHGMTMLNRLAYVFDNHVFVGSRRNGVPCGRIHGSSISVSPAPSLC